MMQPEFRKKSIFKKIITGRGIYGVLGICLVVSLTISYLSVNNVYSKLEGEYNLDLTGSESNWEEEVNKNQSGVPKADSSSEQQKSSSQSQSSQGQSDGLQNQENSSEVQKVLYSLPMSGEILARYSGNELVKNKTMNDWRVHTGIDIKAELNDVVKAVADGTVTKIYSDPTYGTVLEIVHPDEVVSYYMGLVQNVPVKKGDKVTRGQGIGVVGEIPGEVADVYHLHFEMRKNGKLIDPIETIGDVVYD